MGKNGGEVHNYGNHHEKDYLSDIDQELVALYPPRVEIFDFYKAKLKRIGFVPFRNFTFILGISDFSAVKTGLLFSIGPESTMFAFNLPKGHFYAFGLNHWQNYARLIK